MKVIVTRPRAQAEPLVSRLKELGLEVVECPLIEIVPSDYPVDVEGYEWVIVSSSNGARELVRRATGPLPKVAAVGPGTAETLRDLGVEPAFVPSVSTMDALLEEFEQPEGRVLYAAAAGARGYDLLALEADFTALYETRQIQPPVPPHGDLVVLASGSAARSFAALVRNKEIPAVTIGPQTTRVAKEWGLDVVAEAETHDLDGLVEAVRRLASR